MATPIPENRVVFTVEEILEATGGSARGPAFERVSGVVTDSRAVREGNLFVALVGDRFDAHEFVVPAFEQGAAAVLVAGGAELPEHVSGIEVDDTLVALGDLGRLHRRRWGRQLIGITGSVGKTTTKNLASAALRATGRQVLATTGNLNNRVGVPMTLFQLDDSVDTAVIEMGTSEPGEIPRLAAITEPDAAIVTRASLAHTEGLGTVEAVADEKVSLLQALSPDGVAVAYGDDAPVKKRASVVKAKRKLFYGRAAGSDVRVLDWEVDADGTHAQFQVRGQGVDIEMGLVGEGAVLNAAAVFALAFGLGLPLEAAAKGLVQVEPEPGRMRPLAGRGDRLIIDDTYNANPASVEVAVSTAKAIAQKREAPLVLILGDMKELGAQSEAAHRQVGALAADAGAFLFAGCGAAMQDAVEAANRRGVDTLWFESSSECEGGIADRLPLHCVVLVKGSRSMAMERVFESLLEEPAS
jgi:UDP-N-acetylmuramoyl-tripeptide--D-alanyl-D-alanine ligase